LRIAAEEQNGSLYSSSWTEPLGGDSCVTGSGDGPFPRKRALKVERRRATAKIMLRKSQRPDQLVVSGWRKVDDNGSPAGPRERLPTRLQSHGHGKERYWIATVEVDLATPLYLDVFGRWRDRQGCETTQNGSWAFHLAHRSHLLAPQRRTQNVSEAVAADVGGEQLTKNDQPARGARPSDSSLVENRDFGLIEHDITAGPNDATTGLPPRSAYCALASQLGASLPAGCQSP